MANNEVKRLKFSDGVTVTAPQSLFLEAGSAASFVDAAAYVAAKEAAAADGDMFYNTTTDEIWYYSNGAWSQLADNDSSQVLENKDLTAATNTFNASGLSTGTVPDARIASSSITQHEGDIAINNVSGTLGIAKGGTGQTTATEAFDALAPTLDKGDIIAHNGTDNVAISPTLPTDDGKVLTVDSAQSTGWTLTSPLTNPMDSDGDLIIGGASGAATKLDHPGASDYVLATTGASTTAWTNSPTVPNATVSTQLGVGGAASAHELDVTGAMRATTNLYLGTTGNTLGSAASPAIAHNTDTNTGIYFGDGVNDGVGITADGVTAIFAKDGGNVGIKTEDPLALLHVYGYGTDADPSLQLGTATSDAFLNTPSANIIVFGHNATEQGRMHSDGALHWGNGITSHDNFESTQLVVSGVDGQVSTILDAHFDTDQVALFMNNDDAIVSIMCDGAAGKESQLRLGKEGDVFKGVLAYNVDNDYVALRHASTTGVNVKSTGDIGLGTTSPNSLVHVYDSAASAATPRTDCPLVVERTGSAGINILAATQGVIAFGDAADNDAGLIAYTHAGDDFDFVIGGNSYINLSNNGLSFPQTTGSGASASLSAYEEGSYSATVDNLSNCSGPGSTSLRYHRIGNVVTVWGKFTLTVSSTGVQASFDISLPVATDNVTAADDVAGFIVPDDTNQSAVPFIVQESGSTTKASARCWTQSSGLTGMVVNFTYRINN